MRITAALVALSVLAGCADSDRRPSGFQAVRDAARQAFGPKISIPAPVITRELLDLLTGPLLQLTNPDGSKAQLELAARRGEEQIWRTASKRIVQLRGGVLAATRGLENDLISSETIGVQAGLDAAVHKNEASSATRKMIFLDGEFAQIAILYECRIDPIGPETIEIIEKNYATFAVQEQCERVSDPGFIAAPKQLDNRYWIERDAANTVRLSRQWGGPGLGVVTIEQLSP